MLARFVLECGPHAGAGEFDDNVPVFPDQRFAAQTKRSGVLEVGVGEVLDEELAVGATLAELKLDDDFVRVAKGSSEPGARCSSPLR
jgi:hypothetical protein